MIQYEVQIRVRYAETDQMQYVYYGNYAAYFEVARVELLRKLGLSYKSLEEMGIWMPVMDFSIEYKAPARYDDVLDIKVMVNEMPSSRMIFLYETYCEGRCLNLAKTTLVFVDQTTQRPVRCPQELSSIIKSEWK